MILIAVLVTALVAVAFVGLEGDHPPATSPDLVEGQYNSSRDRSDSLAAGGDRAKADATIKAEDPNIPTVDEPPVSSAFLFRLRVVDPSGTAVSGLQLHFAHTPMWDRPRSHRQVRVVHEAVSDDWGVATVALQRPQTFYVKAESDVWHLETSIDAKPDAVPVLVARAAAAIYLSVVTDAGAPWYGQIRITAAGDGRQFHAFLREGEVAKVERLPVDDLTLLFYECVIGVDEQSRLIPASDIQTDATLHITLKTNPNNKTGAIEVDTSAFPTEIRELRILIGASGANTWIEPGSTFRNDKVWRSRPLWPQSYTVRIIGRNDDDPIWTSDPITVKPREITKVAVIMGEVCGVRVDVTDERSDPIQDALLLLGDDRLPNFDFMQPSPGSVALSDSDGHAALSGLRTGIHKFTVAAKGYEPQVLEAELTGGEVRFLGVVQLNKATGAITVKLTGMQEKQKYTIMVLKPGGTTLHSARDIKEATTSFTGLSFSTYMVAVVAGKGGKPVTVTVTLTGDEPGASVEVDVAALVESKLK